MQVIKNNKFIAFNRGFDKIGINYIVALSRRLVRLALQSNNSAIVSIREE